MTSGLLARDSFTGSMTRRARERAGNEEATPADPIRRRREAGRHLAQRLS
ncbi:hypothetical protein [Microbacterium luticocti]|nr:hypothetical protein [Microbacterium luticocti]